MGQCPGCVFEPFAWETFGGFGARGWLFLRHLARLCLSSVRRASLSPDQERLWLRLSRSYLGQRLSVAALHQHCALIRDRVLALEAAARDLAAPAGAFEPRHPGPIRLSDLCYVCDEEDETL